MFFTRVKNSVIARMQNWERRHFHLTKYGKKLAQYRNIHQGERCFIIGNGPSLRAEDLQILHDNHVVTFASNRIYHMFDQTQWRPTYYASEDLTILQSIQDTVANLTCSAIFLPINHKWDGYVDVPGATWFYLDSASDFEDTFGLSLDITRGIRCRGTVTMSCLQLALYMGFTEIYLLGVDHNYSSYIDSSGKLVVDPTVKDYFSAEYDTDFKNEIKRDLGSSTLSYLSAEKLSRRNGGFRVYNSTRGGKLEVFERVDFDAIFNQ